MNLVRSAISFCAHASRHVGLIFGLEFFSSRLTKDRESRIGLPKMIMAGKMLQSGSGLFRNCSSTLSSLS